jgi:hypothetical protein
VVWRVMGWGWLVFDRTGERAGWSVERLSWGVSSSRGVEGERRGRRQEWWGVGGSVGSSVSECGVAVEGAGVGAG